MRKPMRRPVAIVLLALVASLLGVVTPGAAYAAESIPTLQWPPVISGSLPKIYGGPSGSTVVACRNDSGSSNYDGNVRTYNASGQLVQDIPRTDLIDGVPNCMWDLAVGKDGDVYGFPYGKPTGGSWTTGPNLLAYDGNTLKWKYPASCGSSGYPPAVGADGNVYTLTKLSNGEVHLLGLTPEVAAGQTQPTKVLDIKVPGDCVTQLFTYKDGIMLRGDRTSGALFYSYAGKSLGQAAGSRGMEKLNANGQLFYPTFTATSNGRGANVAMYDSLTNTVVWTRAVSTPGANVNDIQVYPVPGGGVIAFIQEQKMVTDGVPASPTEWVYTIAAVNSAGLKVKTETLPNTFGSNVTYGTTSGSARANLDTSGKLAVLRTAKMTVTTASGSTKVVPAIALSVYNLVSDTWIYQEFMTGDALKAGGPNGYSLHDGPFLTNDTLLFEASCSGNCGDTYIKLYAAKVTGLGMDYPRGGVIAGPIPKPYVALGDSYSSGEGVLPFQGGTDVDNVNTCHRSYYAYSQVVARASNSLSLGAGGFYACSGAETKHIQDVAQWNEGTQLSHLNASTKVVTLTIGGNDIGFVDFGTACVAGTCDFSSGIYTTTVNKIYNELPAKLIDTYKKILAAAPNAQVYVLDYPQVAPIKQADDPDDPRCSYLRFSGDGNTWEDARAARDIVDRLNTMIGQKVDDVRQLSTDNHRLHYIDVNKPDSPFAGHTVCAAPGESYFNNIDEWVGHPAYALHPNERGQQAYADLATAAINAG